MPANSDLSHEKGGPNPVLPPLPAPYLADAPQLSDSLAKRLAKDRIAEWEESFATGLIAALALEIRQRRTAWENLEGVQIVPEPPTDPWAIP